MGNRLGIEQVRSLKFGVRSNTYKYLSLLNFILTQIRHESIVFAEKTPTQMLNLLYRIYTFLLT